MTGNIGYQSDFTENSSGRVNMAARWYNPNTGQFDNRDPASNNPTPNSANADRYTYANGNPLTNTDPTGLCPADRCDGYGLSPGITTPGVVHEKRYPYDRPTP